MESDDSDGLPYLTPEALAEILAIENQDPADISEWFSQEMLDYERCYRNSGNPIYVWLAIAVATKNDWRPVYGRQPDVGIPVWCLDYLQASATNILALAGGAAAQKYAADKARRLGKIKASGKLTRSDSAATRAIRQVPRALGLAPCAGRSAFRDYAGDELSSHRTAGYDLSLHLGASSREAKEAALTDMGTADEQVLTRALSKYRELRK